MSDKSAKSKLDRPQPISVYVEGEMVREIDRLAKETRRSRSQMVAVLIEEGLATHKEASSRA